MIQETFLTENTKKDIPVEIKKRNLPELKLSPNSLIVLKKRYLKKISDTETEKPEEMFMRIAKNIAEAEKIYDPYIPQDKYENIIDAFYSMMVNLYFLPNSPTLMNAGRDLQQLSACFVLPVEDSMEDIFNTVRDAALIHKSGGGTGFSFSRLRQKNDRVKTTGGVASGPVSFMKVFNSATEAVKQGGTRRGANMGILNIDHPDIIEFITVKNNTKELNNFNLSVAITDKFMEAVFKDEEYELINPHNKQVEKKMKARDVFNLIVDSAWKTGEPGVIFIDTVNKDNPTPGLGRIESTNPCGEQPLLPYEACNLGSINLAKMIKVTNGKTETDYQLLKETIYLAVRFLDNVIDMNKYPLPEIDAMAKGNRKIGLGVMGFADMLVLVGIPYNSNDAIKTAERVMRFIDEESKKASSNLAKERGPFTNFEKSIYNGYTHVRNSTTTTIAPTGTLSIIANVSSGVEPLFAISYIRTVMDNTKMLEVNHYFEKVAKGMGFYNEPLLKEIAEKNSLKDIKDIPDDIKKVFVTAHDISPEWHVKMQAAFQKFTDNAVSKTINFSKDATKEDIKMAYILAYKEGCKGLAVYRDGSREEQVLSTGTTKSKTETGSQKITPRSRPSVTTGRTQKISTGCGNLYVTINEDENGPCEVFAQMGKSGGCAASQSEATSRLISLSLRSGIDIEAVLKQLKGIRCPSPLWDKGNMVLSCPDAIAKAIENYLQNGSTPKKKGGNGNSSTKNLAGMCPECGNVLEYVEDCVLCRFCGYSKCG
ncbi:MAG: vitamin B12-dependent ribonucleotide reductase [Candidatus Firestonebacteria bacterium]